MTDQTMIQQRYLDPFEKLTSEATNKILMSVYTTGVGIREGYEVTKTASLVVNVTKGVLVKDFVVIEYTDDVIVDLDPLHTGTVTDGLYYVVCRYVYQRTSPPPTAEILAIPKNQYDENQHVILSILDVSGNDIVHIWDTDPNDPTRTRPVFSTGEHNSLLGLQGGDGSTQYYHLDLNQYHFVENLIATGVVSHNSLNDLDGGSPAAGGAPAEYYHLTDSEHSGVIRILSGIDKVPNADKLDDKDSSDFALVNHNHEHNSLLGLQGGNGTDEYYHLSSDSYNQLTGIINGDITVYNTLHLNGHPASDFSLKTHTHDHNDTTNIQGGAADNYYHLTNSEHTTLAGIIAGTIPVPNSTKLGGYDASHFSVVGHNHDHNNLIGVLGGSLNEYYHVSYDLYQAIVNAENPNVGNPFVTKDDLSVIDHNHLGNLQGGDSNLSQYYHFSHDQYSTLTSGNDASSLHTHNTQYYSQSASDARFLRTDGSNAMQGTLNLNFNRIINVKDPQAATDVANRHYVDNWTPSSVLHNDLQGIQGGINNEYYHFSEVQHTLLTSGSDASSLHNHDTLYYRKAEADTLFVNKTGDTMSGDLNMSNNKVTGLPLGDPGQNDAAISKGYLDTLLGQGISVGSGVIVLRSTNDPVVGFTSLNTRDISGFWLFRKN